MMAFPILKDDQKAGGFGMCCDVEFGAFGGAAEGQRDGILLGVRARQQARVRWCLVRGSLKEEEEDEG